MRHVTSSAFCVVVSSKWSTASWTEKKRQDLVTFSLKKPPVCRLSTTPAGRKERRDACVGGQQRQQKKKTENKGRNKTFPGIKWKLVKLHLILSSINVFYDSSLQSNTEQKAISLITGHKTNYVRGSFVINVGAVVVTFPEEPYLIPSNVSRLVQLLLSIVISQYNLPEVNHSRILCKT